MVRPPYLTGMLRVRSTAEGAGHGVVRYVSAVEGAVCSYSQVWVLGSNDRFQLGAQAIHGSVVTGLSRVPPGLPGPSE
jgi:hypothetical protein